MMNRDVFYTQVQERWDIILRVFDHQVSVKVKTGIEICNSLHHVVSERQVRYKMPIHDIEMKHGSPTPLNRFNRLLKV